MATGKLMREDWNKRARDDVIYWINTIYGRNLKNLEEFYADGASWAQKLTAPALQRLGLDPVGRCVLDIGPGIGRLFPGFAALGFTDIWGVDVSDEMVRRGRELCPVGQARFFLGNGRDFTGIPDRSVDFCFSYNVLQHLPSPAILWANMGEVRRVLRPGGAFQLHLRARHPLRRAILRAVPRPARPAAQVLFRLVKLRWLRGGPLQSATVGTESTWDLGAAVPPRKALQRFRRLGFVDLDILPDDTYPEGTRYWIVGRQSQTVGATSSASEAANITA